MPVIREVEAALSEFSVRPHWGKLHNLGRDTLREVFPRLPEAQTLFDRLDPGAVFSNAHLRSLGIRAR
ncbi:D-arabinono-1,4-lactone oxidase [Microbacterium immunditiarum]|uniref:D-arabinono-1,4-lactone oxidase n=1 Tax=Microbacterium immunditiarum TaxID=337480 RepID=UPI001FECD1BB|nr:D-arabinono-1,4-lactone oxidase [Microbacterium immunditiarum]